MYPNEILILLNDFFFLLWHPHMQYGHVIRNHQLSFYFLEDLKLFTIGRMAEAERLKIQDKDLTKKKNYYYLRIY